MIPTDFWNNARRELDEIKPVFMLAEWESKDLHAAAFDMDYAWTWYDSVRAITSGKANLELLFRYYSHNEKEFPLDTFRMLFVSNHDKNSWEGTEFEQFGDALEATIVLSVLSEGMPLLYNGQEAGNTKRLAFFDRDPIEWKQHPLGDLYQKLFALKKAHPALWNGRWGARMIQVVNSAPLQVFSFVRQKEGDKVFAAINFSAETQTVTLTDGPYPGHYVDYFSQAAIELSGTPQLELPPWGYRILVK
jgi:glycosidase